MEKLQSIKLFQDIQLISSKYTSLNLKDDEKEVEDNKNLKSLLGFYKDQIDELTQKYNFVSVQTRDELKNKSAKDINKVLLDFNNFSRQNYGYLLQCEIKSTTVKAVMFSTIDELVLINESIRNKEYANAKDTYLHIYENIVINAFATFLALKDTNLLEDKLIHTLSQSIFAQMQVLSIISM